MSPPVVAGDYCVDWLLEERSVMGLSSFSSYHISFLMGTVAPDPAKAKWGVGG